MNSQNMIYRSRTMNDLLSQTLNHYFHHEKLVYMSGVRKFTIFRGK